MCRASLSNEHGGLESKSDVIEILGEFWVKFDLPVRVLFEIEFLDLVVKFVALVVDGLELFVGGFGVVRLLVDGSEFALDSGEVLAHMEDGEIVGNESKPLFILFGLLSDDVAADVFESVVLHIEEVVRGVLKSLFDGFIQESD